MKHNFFVKILKILAHSSRLVSVVAYYRYDLLKLFTVK